MKRCAACLRIYDSVTAVCQVDGGMLEDLNADPLAGQTIAQRYRIVRKLGGGRLGMVYLAEEVTTGNRVALKVLVKELKCDDESLKQLRWDARFATASQPSHIARVYEVDRTNEGRVFIAMEYLEGQSLAEVIHREGALEPGRALRIASQIGEALAAASKAGVPHRDVKPQNVMVAGRGERVKLTDFGIARLRESAGFGVGAPEYTAPEQLKGGDAADRTDIYALGAVMYAMLTGSGPSTTGEPPQPVRKLRPEAPAALEHFIMQAMEREPEHRQNSMDELVEGLRELTTSGVDRTATVARPAARPVPTPVAPLERPVPRPTLPPLVVTKPVSERPRVELWQSSLAVAMWLLTVLANRWQYELKRGRHAGQKWTASGKLGLATLWQSSLSVVMRLLTALAVRGRYVVSRWRHAGLRWAASGTVGLAELWRSSLGRSTRLLTALASRRSLTLSWARVHVRRLSLTAAAAALVVVGAMAWPVLDRQSMGKAERPMVVASPAGREAESEGTPRIASGTGDLLDNGAARRGAASVTVPEADVVRPRAEAAVAESARQQSARVQPARPEARPSSPSQAARPDVDAESSRARAEASPPRSAEPAPAAQPAPPSLSAQQVSRIQSQAEQKLLRRGLLRASSTDRWGVALEVGATGEVTLKGVLRDMALYAEAVRLVREVPGVQDVRGSVEVSEVGSQSIGQSESARIRAEVQQQLRSRGLLRESSADRWGVTVEVSAEGDVTLVGAVRDSELHREAIRRAQEVARVRQVKQDIKVMEEQ